MVEGEIHAREVEGDDVMRTRVGADVRDPHVSGCKGKKGGWGRWLLRLRGLGLAQLGLGWLGPFIFFGKTFLSFVFLISKTNTTF